MGGVDTTSRRYAPPPPIIRVFRLHALCQLEAIAEGRRMQASESLCTFGANWSRSLRDHSERTGHMEHVVASKWHGGSAKSGRRPWDSLWHASCPS